MSLDKILITIGIAFLITGILYSAGVRLPFGRLPGDIAISNGNFKFYFPIATSIILSIVFSLILYLLRRFG